MNKSSDYEETQSDCLTETIEDDMGIVQFISESQHYEENDHLDNTDKFGPKPKFQVSESPAFCKAQKQNMKPNKNLNISKNNKIKTQTINITELFEQENPQKTIDNIKSNKKKLKTNVSNKQPDESVSDNIQNMEYYHYPTGLSVLPNNMSIEGQQKD